ncbi:hypothetical protein BLA29_003374 [Euroglyphus maynei]|uniref:Uncharacterized protein n=1 Tax=Euroglyphus maynei TaxID=6958 RepID=A0A1Y3AU34_EURMA|nr:hypothetical protein BLA29_003374 [Euroglyphus maynei]
MEKFGRLYPEDMYRYNVHVIHHLPEVVWMYGPLMVSEQVMNKTLMHASIFSSICTNFEEHSVEFLEIVKNQFPRFKKMISPCSMSCVCISQVYCLLDVWILGKLGQLEMDQENPNFSTPANKQHQPQPPQLPPRASLVAAMDSVAEVPETTMLSNASFDIPAAGKIMIFRNYI